jgi:hypothetical protein
MKEYKVMSLFNTGVCQERSRKRYMRCSFFTAMEMWAMVICVMILYNLVGGLCFRGTYHLRLQGTLWAVCTSETLIMTYNITHGHEPECHDKRNSKMQYKI